MSIILVIYLIFLCIAGLGALLYLKKSKPKGVEGVSSKKNKMETAQEFINVMDIRHTFLHTQDKYLMCFINIEPVNIDLMGNRKLQFLTQKLAAEISGITYPFYLLANSKPMDINDVLARYKAEIISTEISERKNVLRNEIYDLTQRLDNNEIPIRDFTLLLWTEYDEDAIAILKKRAEEMMASFKSAGIKTNILGQQDIVRLINLISNPSFSPSDDDWYLSVGLMQLIDDGQSDVGGE
ncbi:hypothetical protein [Eubacterium aggregans]|uniref:hypothetical protein n=1 Tax=Eubacterium aggregans TaxID=81409 RepID=UPI003F387548